MRYNEFNISDPVEELEKRLVRIGRGPLDINVIKRLVNRISTRHKIPKETLHSLFVKKHGHSPDTWISKIKQRNEEIQEGDIDEGFLDFFKSQQQSKPSRFDYNAAREFMGAAGKRLGPAKKTYNNPEEYYQDQRNSGLVAVEEDTNSNEEQINKFIEWTKQTLHVKGEPKFTFSNDTDKAQEGHHTGVHSGDDIWVYIGNRNLVDIFRTVFHELVHQRQQELGMIKDGDSYPGSPIEAMADMLAGKYIKIYGKEHPEIFQ